ncbi:MAG TPA: peptide deformylase [Candidatus Paceibacterota bacterium]
MVNILQKDDPILRHKAVEVPVADISSAKIRAIIADMKKALAGEKDGVAIAAPQIGVPLRIFVVSGLLLKDMNLDKNATGEDQVFINPVIVKLSRTKEEMEEGCLSVRYLYGTIKRATKAIVRAHDETGKIFERGGSGLLAQIFQHETDHLEGKLFIDFAKNVHEMEPEV